MVFQAIRSFVLSFFLSFIHSCLYTFAVPDGLGHNALSVLHIGEAELGSHICQRYPAVGQADSAQPGSDDIMPQPHNEVLHLVCLERAVMLLSCLPAQA